MNKKRIITIITVVILIMAAYLISAFLVQLMLIQGDSMSPAFKDKALVLVDKRNITYKTDDVIVFRKEEIKGVIVKRIVAMEGDIVIIENGCLYVNGVTKSGFDNRDIAYAGAAEEEIIIPAGMCFVMGDNYNSSIDSRYEEIGMVAVDSIIGRIIE